VAVSERRLVTVLFADLVGFTTLAESRDAEAVRDLLSRYFEQCQEVIGRYGGTVEKFIGDAVMAVWGAPIAHDDDAERAVRAALDLVDGVRALGPGIQARAGVLTGEAAVTVGATNQGLVAGDIVNTASRLQSVAAPGTVLVGEQTEQAANSAIAFEPAGDQVLKGKIAPVAAFRAIRIVAERGGRGRTDQLEAPFVGRDDEYRLLRDVILATARDKRPRLVSITGVPGVGKSRMARELTKYIDGLVDTIYWHAGRSPAYGEGVTFWALGEMVRGRIGLVEGDDEAATRAAVTSGVARWVADETERRWIEHALLVLLGFEGSGGAAREELFSAWRTFFERIAASGPVVLLFEDLHWADAGLLDFIDHLLDWSSGVPLTVVTLARPELLERRPGWGTGTRTFIGLALEPLPDDAIGEILEALAPGLQGAGRATVIARADGIPLYAVETIRMLAAAGSLGGVDAQPVDLSDLAVPATLQALIAARLDALDPGDRSLICDAAVLGQSFTLAGLGAVSGLEADGLDASIRSLVRRELLVHDVDPRSPERGQYAFVQSLVREVAYGTLSRPDRRNRHLAAARFFEGLGEDELAGALASHYLAAYRASSDDPEGQALAAQARLALRGAAERATELGSHDQAGIFFLEALEVSSDQADRADLLERAGLAADAAAHSEIAEERLAEAAAIWHGLGEREREARAIGLRGRAVVNGWRAPAAIAILEPALAAFEDLGDDPALVQIEHQLARAYWFEEDRARAVPLADRALGRAERLDDIANVADILVTKGALITVDGRPYEGFGSMEAGRALAAERGLNAIVARALLNMTGTQMSRNPREAFELGIEAIALARRIGFRSFLATAAGNSLEVAGDLGELDWAMTIGDELLALDFASNDRSSLLRGINQVRLLRGEPVDDLFAEHAEALAPGVDVQEVSNYEGAEGFRSFLACDFAGAAAHWEMACRKATLNAPSDLPRAARAAIWAGDVPTAERLTAEFARDWTHGQCAHARLAGLMAGLAASNGRRDEAVVGFGTAITSLRDLGLEVEAVLTVLDMSRTVGATDPAVAPWLDEARATIERLRMPGLNGLVEAASAGSATAAQAARPVAPGKTVAAEATG
jgi:class 3 adenylate cyclase/tetratricopeptide (TPR) repeat protein